MILQRSGAKGAYVLFPKDWDKRWLSPQNRRWQTGCDMVVGGCSCGRHHELGDDETDDILNRYGATVESHSDWLERQREKGSANVRTN